MVSQRRAQRTRAQEVARRRHGSELEQAIFEATFEEIVDIGYSRLSFDGVARRAGTGKAAIYRRWSTKQELVLDAFDSVRPKEPPALVGNLRDDLINYFTFHFIGRPHGSADDAARRLIADVHRIPELLNQLVEMFWSPGLNGVRRILRAAAGRGEIDVQLITPEVLEVIPGTLLNRSFLNRGEITKAHIGRLIDRVLLPALGYEGSEG